MITETNYYWGTEYMLQQMENDKTCTDTVRIAINDLREIFKDCNIEEGETPGELTYGEPEVNIRINAEAGNLMEVVRIIHEQIEWFQNETFGSNIFTWFLRFHWLFGQIKMGKI